MVYEDLDEDYIKFLEFKNKIENTINNSKSEEMERNLHKIGFTKIFKLKDLNLFLSEDTNTIIVLGEEINYKLYYKAMASYNPVKQRKGNSNGFGDFDKQGFIEGLTDKDGILKEEDKESIDSFEFEWNVSNMIIKSKPDELEDNLSKLGFEKVFEQENDTWFFSKDSIYIIMLVDNRHSHIYC